jgi:glycyl-tRNA synthetase
MAEIEHFVDPGDKQHPKFKSVADLKLTLFPACNQLDGTGPVEMAIGEAVKRGVVDNETLGYYMARAHLFLVSVGVDPGRLRFRQHLSNEMAHYAKDCWDAECHCSYGWSLPCCVAVYPTGLLCASAFRLDRVRRVRGPSLLRPHPAREGHGRGVGGNATSRRAEDFARGEGCPEQGCDWQEVQVPHEEGSVSVEGGYRRVADGDRWFQILERLVSMAPEEVEDLDKVIQQLGKVSINVDGQSFELEKGLVEVGRRVQSIHVEEVHPSVIEPSFGESDFVVPLSLLH